MKLNNANKVFSWLWKDLLFPKRKAFTQNFLLDVVAFSSQLGAYGILFKYISALEENATLHFMGVAYVPKSSHTLLLVVAVCTGLLFIVSSIFSYWSKIRTVNLTREYELHCSHRVFSALHDSVQSNKEQQTDSNNYDFKKIRRALIKDARFCGKMVPVVSFSIIVAIKFILSLVFMFNINLLLTGIILFMIIPFFLLSKRIGKRVVGLTKDREAKLILFINAKKVLMQTIFENPKQTKEELQSADNDPEIMSFYDTYFGLLKKLALNDLLSVSFIALLAVVVILTGGKLVLFGNMSWSIFIAYMIALRFFFSSLQGLSSLVKKNSKIYEYVNHYTQLLRGLESGDHSSVTNDIQRKIVIKGKFKDVGLDLDDDDDDDDGDL